MASQSQSYEDNIVPHYEEIQDIGFIILTNHKLNILSCSENYLTYLGDYWDNCLNKNLLSELKYQNHLSDQQYFNLQQAIREQNLLESIEITIHGKPFHLSIHEDQGIYYFEFEFKVEDPLMNIHRIHSRILGIQQGQLDVWKMLCDYMQEVVCMDRVMVLQFKDDQSAVVIAESLNNTSLDSYLDYHYPQFDILSQNKLMFLKKHCRFVTNINQNGISLIDSDIATINLSVLNIRSLVPFHVDFLRNAGLKSSITFSIIINNTLWGLVSCQSHEPRHIDLANRNIALALTYAATYKFQEQRNIKLILFKEKVQEFELLLKEKLLLKEDPIGELNQLVDDLSWFMRSDGMALIHQNIIHLHGETPNEQDIHDLIHEIVSSNDGNTLLASANIQSIISNLPSSFKEFPGVATFIVNDNRDLSIIWFRKEIVFDRKWAGKPKIEDLNSGPMTHETYSKIRSFDLWVEHVQGKSIPWNERQNYFLTRIKHIVLNALIQKSQEIEHLNKKLIERNNALDTYAYTVSHDLKNPLTAIKLSAQFLQQRQLLEAAHINKFTERITQSVDQICSMLDRIHDLAAANSITFKKEKLELLDMIEGIIFQCRARYNYQESIIETKNIIPIYGEKTLIYQLFLNLIGNAIKYSSKNTHPYVQIFAEQEDKFTAYYIKDNGIGMEEADLSSIFEIFKRMDNAQDFEGSGIGMSIVKRIIDKLEIQINIESAINQGTCIQLLFPHPEQTH